METNRAALKNLNDADVDVTVQYLDWNDFTASSETVDAESEAIAPRDADHLGPVSNGRAPTGGFDATVGGGAGAASGDAAAGWLDGAGRAGSIANVDDALGTPEVVLAADVVYDLR